MFTRGRPLSTIDDSWPLSAGLLTPMLSDEETSTERTSISHAGHASDPKKFKSDMMKQSQPSFRKIPSSWVRHVVFMNKITNTI